jgi:O-antigen/teichoic acid export membrane protein
LSIDHRSIKKKAVRAGTWLAVGNGTAKLANFVKNAILAHLLSPTDFGQMGIAFMVLQWLEYFTETGFKTALVQQSGDIRRFFDTAWTVQVARALLLAGVVLVVAPSVALFFDAPSSVAVIRVIALILLLRGLASPALVELQRNLEFGRHTAWNLSGAVTGLLVGVALGLAAPSVWALMWSVVAAEATRTIASYFFAPYRPRFSVDFSAARSLFSFGQWILYFNVLTFFTQNLDGIAVGRLLGTGALGLYGMARQCAFLFALSFAHVVASVLFPALARMDIVERPRAFVEAFSLAASVITLSAFALTFAASSVVRLVFGAQWVQAVPAVAILAWAGCFASLSGIAYSLFHASGKPNYSFQAVLTKALLLALLLYPLTKSFGVLGASISVVLSEAGAFALSLVLVARVTAGSLADIPRPFATPLRTCFPVVIMAAIRMRWYGVAIDVITAAAVALASALLLQEVKTRVLGKVGWWGAGTSLSPGAAPAKSD